MERVGLGILTHARPEFFGRLVDSVMSNLDGFELDAVAVHGYPGTGGGYGDPTDRLRRWARRERIDWRLTATPTPTTCAQGKNTLLHGLADCDWVFLAEDDVEIIDSAVLRNYVAAASDAGVDHLAFHAHGPANPPDSGRLLGPITSWFNSIGAFNLYSRRALDAVGYFDEGFHNAWEHVEHTLRISLAGFGGSHRAYLDATDSENWVREQPGAIESSVIRPDPDWERHVSEGKQHWAQAHPDSFRLIWPGGQ